MVASVTRTTLTLPADLLARVDLAVRQGRARSRNSFVAAALERDLAAQEQADLDAEFAAMAQDEEYLAESTQLDAEFAGASADALRLAEGRM
jgi:Arc/MetJ-type ribon-helix-helix transcriptional regulator